MTPAVKAILFTNVAVFVVTFLAPEFVVGHLGLSPAADHQRSAGLAAGHASVRARSAQHHAHPIQHALLWMFGV
jgi:hypothetical protein